MLRFINLISGGGSTNLSILQAESLEGELGGLIETVAIISSNPEAKGIEKALEFGFPKRHIHVVNPDNNLTNQLLSFFNQYRPDYFHQLGWLPWTPTEFLQSYTGLNQHLGPGGKWMYGERRIFAHICFCELTDQVLPIPVFCQYVGPEYDEGNIIYTEYVEIDLAKDPEELAKELLPFEHRVQIKGRSLLAKGNFQVQPVPNYAFNPREEEMLEQAKKEAREKYPPEK